MIFYLRWLAAPPFLWTKTTENQFSTFLLYRFFKLASTGNHPNEIVQNSNLNQVEIFQNMVVR